jgi:hypothetical protein
VTFSTLIITRLSLLNLEKSELTSVCILATTMPKDHHGDLPVNTGITVVSRQAKRTKIDHIEIMRTKIGQCHLS